MLFAVAVMDPTIKMIFYAAAVVLFALAAIGFERGKVSFVAQVLAVLCIPFFWDALATMQGPAASSHVERALRMPGPRVLGGRVTGSPVKTTAGCPGGPASPDIPWCQPVPDRRGGALGAHPVNGGQSVAVRPRLRAVGGAATGSIFPADAAS